MHNVLVIHGPSLNMLGLREPNIYGNTRLDDINTELKKLGKTIGICVETFQSNSESAIIGALQKNLEKISGLLINAAAFTHTSIAIRDALLLHTVPIIEVHLSNIYKRESFRHKSLIADIATGQLSGFGVNSYYLGLRAMADILNTPDS
ncbi:MAG: type II 3-dehydroquinate dehydratase [Desulfobacteraceae bacterium]|nr:type II 3-dehydroquinate dehydratase [Desulfobacteraceae bacterium]